MVPIAASPHAAGWLDFPRTKYPNSTLPEPGVPFREAVARHENPGFDTIQELYSERRGYSPDEHGGEGQDGVYRTTAGEKQQIGAFDEGGAALGGIMDREELAYVILFMPRAGLVYYDRGYLVLQGSRASGSLTGSPSIHS